MKAARKLKGIAAPVPAGANVKAVEDMASRVMLTTLTLSAWRVNRRHTKETEATQKRHGTQAAFVVVKLSDHPALAELGAVHSAAYAWHRLMTMPACQDGFRLVPAKRQFEHSEKMREFADQHAAIVRRFIGEYDAAKAAAKKALKDLWQEDMWPSRPEMEGAFGFHTRYLACPTGGAWGEWLVESAKVAEASIRDRLREALERVRDRCQSDGALFATVFTNLGELVELVPDLNLTGAEDITKAIAAAKPIAETPVETVRDDEAKRTAIASQASKILTLLGGVK